MTASVPFGSILPMPDNLIPLADLVGTFHRSKTTLYRWAATGQIPTRKIGSTIYMHEDDVKRYTANREAVIGQIKSRRTEYGRILDAETITLIIQALQDALDSLRDNKASGE